MSDIVLLCTFFGVFIMFSFLLGIKIGISISLKKDIEIKSPLKIIKEHKENKQAELDREYEERIEEINMYNIDAYDGTGLGQKTFPNRKE